MVRDSSKFPSQATFPNSSRSYRDRPTKNRSMASSVARFVFVLAARIAAFINLSSNFMVIRIVRHSGHPILP